MSAESTETPTFSEVVIGYRNWRVDAWGQLQSTAVRVHGGWVPGENIATCQHNREFTEEDRDFWDLPVMEPHGSPHPDCECGLYARFRVPDTVPNPWVTMWYAQPKYDLAPRVTGAIAAYGTIEVHQDGFRAERAKILCLALTDDKKLNSLIESVADTYEVPAVPRDVLEVEALLYGSHLPESVIPEKPKPEVRDYYAEMEQAVASLRASNERLLKGQEERNKRRAEIRQRLEGKKEPTKRKPWHKR